MSNKGMSAWIVLGVFLMVSAAPGIAQSFRVQCPVSTITHPIVPIPPNKTIDCSANPTTPGCNNTEPAYNGPTQFTTIPASGSQGGYVMPTAGTANGAIKCQQISGGDGFMTEADGTQTFMFAFGPLSGLADIAAGLPGSEFPYIFNTPYSAVSTTALTRGDPATTDGAASGASPWLGSPGAYEPAFTWNGAVGLTPEITNIVTVANLVEGPITAALYPGTTVPGCPTTTASANTVTGWTDAPLGLPAGAQVVISNVVAEGPTPTPPGYAGTWTISCVATGNGAAMSPDGVIEYAFQYVDSTAGLAEDTGNDAAAVAASPSAYNGHVDPRQIMDVGVMNGNIPGPLFAFDEDDEFFLTLTNVGMIMRPDLFEQHTVHFHGYPNASSFYDGVPDASVAINIGASFTYYYLAPDAGTYFWHCHITPPEHLQMGMVGQVYVRPRQDRVPTGWEADTVSRVPERWHDGVPTAHVKSVADPRTICNPATDILCSAAMPAIDTGATRPAAGTLCSGANGGLGNRGDNAPICIQRRRWLDMLRRHVPHPDARLRPQLPFRRHDLQPGNVRGHE